MKPVKVLRVKPLLVQNLTFGSMAPFDEVVFMSLFSLLLEALEAVVNVDHNSVMLVEKFKVGFIGHIDFSWQSQWRHCECSL